LAHGFAFSFGGLIQIALTKAERNHSQESKTNQNEVLFHYSAPFRI
jgi:hypothetical protein